MSNYQPSPTGEGRGGMEFLFFGLLAAMLLVGTWFLVREPLMWISFYLSYFMFKGYAFVHDFFPYLMTKGEYRELMSAIKHIPSTDPTRHGWSALMTMFKMHGFVGRWVLVPLTLWWGWRTYKGVVRFKYRRRIKNIYMLIDIQSRFFPASAVIKGKNLLKMHPYVGPWATYALPLDFALDNQMLWVSRTMVNLDSQIDKKTMFPIPPFKPEQKVLGFPHKRKLMPHHNYVAIDLDACHDTFAKQLGERWNGYKSLPPLEKALYAILCAQMSSKQTEAWKMIEQVAFSWREGTFDAKGKMLTPHYANIAGCDAMVAKYGNTQAIKDIEGLHFHKYNVLQAMLTAARKKGRLMHSNLMWLRPTDKVLWNVLCSNGGQVPYWEAAGPWAHAQVEELTGRAIAVPMVAGAVIAMKTLMSREHWIDPAEHGEEAQQRLVTEANEVIENAKKEMAAEKVKGAGGAGNMMRDNELQRKQKQDLERQRLARAAARKKEDDEP